MKKHFLFITFYLLLTTYHSFGQVQWATKLVDFSSEFSKDIPENSTRYKASQVLGPPNTAQYGESPLAWAIGKTQAGKEHITVGFSNPQTVQQIIIGESLNAGSIREIILYDNNGKSSTVYENKNTSYQQKYGDFLTYIKITPKYNINKLKLILNTNVPGMQQIDCIGISSTTQPYNPTINVVRYSEKIGMPENLGANVNSSYYDHLPIVSPDGKTLYFARKFAEDNVGKDHKDDIYFSKLTPIGKWSKAENIGEPLNTEMHNYVCFVSTDNKRLYLANKYKKGGEEGVSMSTKKVDGTWSKPKSLNIKNIYNKNEYSNYTLSLDENVMLMCLQRDDSYGDLDMYVSFKYADGDWSEPMNLGAKVNTVGAEGSVFLAADNKTIYFSSAGRQGFGSYDMYMCKRLDQSWKNWSEPLNLGDIINSPKIDIYYTIPPQGDYIYYSSEDSYYGLNDLFRIKLPKEARPEAVDMAKILANAPLKSEVPNNALDKKLAQLKSDQTKPAPVVTQPTQPKTTVQPTTTNPIVTKPNDATIAMQKKLDELNKPVQAPTQPATQPVAATTPVKPAVTTQPATDELQKKLDALKQQQAQVPTQTPAVQQPIVTTTPKQEVTQAAVVPSTPTVATTPVKPSVPTQPATDELQKKLEALKQQQAQVPTQTPVVQQPIAQVVQPTVVSTPTQVTEQPVVQQPTQPKVVYKKEVVNSITPYQAPETNKPKVEQINSIKPYQPEENKPKVEQINSITPYQTEEEKRPKAEQINTVKPYEAPKPAPKVLTPEERAAQQQVKSNPTYNPANDDIARLKTMQKDPTLVAPTTTVTSNPDAIKYDPNKTINDGIKNMDPIAYKVEEKEIATTAPTTTYKTNEVDPNKYAQQPSTYNQPLKKSEPATDELQQKLDELKKQQTAQTAKVSTPQTINNNKPYDPYVNNKTYENPTAPLPTTNAKTESLDQKLAELKSQQYQQPQSTRIDNPNVNKPYNVTTVKERQEDPASKDYDEYQKKLDALKAQQKSPTVTAPAPTTTYVQPVQKTETVTPKTTYETPKNNVTNTPTSTAPNPAIAKYEEKLRKMKEEMNAIGAAPTTATSTKIEPVISNQPTQPLAINTAPVVTSNNNATDDLQKKLDDLKSQLDKPKVVETIVVGTVEPANTNTTPITSTEQEKPVIADIPAVTAQPIATAPMIDLSAEKAKLDSLQDAQKLASQQLIATLDKMGSNKQDLEKDIADLQVQRDKVSTDKDKLAAENSELIGEKQRLELEKKKMDDLLAQMQAERDKLAAEKAKMELDKAKLDALKKQQEREVLSMKRAIDSLAKIKQTASTNAALQQKYDLFNVPIEVGAVAIADKIFFVADGAYLQIPSYPELDKVVAFLKKNSKLKIEIGGHTNGLCDDAFCNQLSNNRAKTCVDYLISKGIAKDRLQYKGYGKQFLIASPGSPLNQRVEIKILSVG